MPRVVFCKDHGGHSPPEECLVCIGEAKQALIVTKEPEILPLAIRKIPPEQEPEPETGDRSQYMESPVAARYLDSLQDRELLNLRRDLATIETRIQDLMVTVAQNESLGTWNELQRAGVEFMRLWSTRQTERAQQQIMMILDLIENGYIKANGWEDLQRCMELRRKLSESETKRLQAMKQFVTADRAIELINDVGEVIKRNVLDTETRRRIITELRRLVASDVN